MYIFVIKSIATANRSNQKLLNMEAIIGNLEIPSKDNFKAKTQIKLPKIVLGKGRNMAEIDYDAVFDNRTKK